MREKRLRKTLSNTDAQKNRVIQLGKLHGRGVLIKRPPNHNLGQILYRTVGQPSQQGFFIHQSGNNRRLLNKLKPEYSSGFKKILIEL